MKITDVVSTVEMEMKESQNQRDKRVEELWRKLDPQGQGELDFKGLQKGLRRIDHPMKNADNMLKAIVQTVDTNGDGKIQYEEFRVFVEAAERQLLLLFRAIDRDQDGHLDKEELRAAFQKAGLSVPMRRLSGFFDEIDMNHDGYITFDEWRDFLLFMPTQEGGSPLEAALSFYSSIVTLTAEGDSVVSDDTLEGLGTTGSLLQTLFGSLLKLADPDQLYPNHQTSTATSTPATIERLSPAARSALAEDADWLSSPTNMAAAVQATDNAIKLLMTQLEEEEAALHTYPAHQKAAAKSVKSRLTEYLPEPGYFLAGAISGGVSRTATAPLDRLKVYLLVNIKSGTTTVAPLTAKTSGGAPPKVVVKSGKPIGDAIMSLWRAGGFRTFFAGNGLNVIKIMPETAIRFGSYEAAKRALATWEGHGDPQNINTWSKFVAGGIGGMTAQFCVYPIDTLKFRLQCEIVEGGLKGNPLLIQTAKTMWRDGGIRAAYRGLTMGLVGMFPYSAIDIGAFELLKNTFTKHKARYYGIHEEDAAPGSLVTAFIGASSGAFGATVVYPLNVLRTRLQTQGTAMHPPTYTGIWDVAQRTVRNEGVRGLYKGLTPNLLKVAPALSITWVCYENSKKLLGLN